MSKTQQRLKLICLSAMMAAIFVVLDYFSDAVSLPLGNHKLSFNGLPILIVSIFGGPVWGAVTGLVGSFISQLRWGFEAMTALWILPEVARGFLMGIIFVALKRRTKPWALGIGVVTSSVAVTLLNTLALIVNYYVYGVGKGLYVLLVVELPTRLLLGITTAVLMTVVLSIITPPLKEVTRL